MRNRIVLLTGKQWYLIREVLMTHLSTIEIDVCDFVKQQEADDIQDLLADFNANTTLVDN